MFIFQYKYFPLDPNYITANLKKSESFVQVGSVQFRGFLASVGSVGSVESAGSVGSVGSVGYVGSVGSEESVGSEGSVGSV